MDPSGEQHCPGCGIVQPVNPRHPMRFCPSCLELAEDGDGRRLVFGNVALSGGLSWAYADDPARRDDRVTSIACLIAGQPVLVAEARFGGVVAEPLPADRVGADTVDLTRPAALAVSRLRLVPDRTRT